MYKEDIFIVNLNKDISTEKVKEYLESINYNVVDKHDRNNYRLVVINGNHATYYRSAGSYELDFTKHIHSEKQENNIQNMQRVVEIGGVTGVFIPDINKHEILMEAKRKYGRGSLFQGDIKIVEVECQDHYWVGNTIRCGAIPMSQWLGGGEKFPVIWNNGVWAKRYYHKHGKIFEKESGLYIKSYI